VEPARRNGPGADFVPFLFWGFFLILPLVRSLRAFTASLTAFFSLGNDFTSAMLQCKFGRVRGHRKHLRFKYVIKKNIMPSCSCI